MQLLQKMEGGKARAYRSCEGKSRWGNLPDLLDLGAWLVRKIPQEDGSMRKWHVECRCMHFQIAISDMGDLRKKPMLDGQRYRTAVSNCPGPYPVGKHVVVLL